MKIGFIGLGKMGASMTERLVQNEHQVFAYDVSEKARQGASEKGAQIVESLHALIERLPIPHIKEYTVRGQYGPGRVKDEDVPGYRDEKDVSPDSNTPTFIAAKFFIDNWRWAGVPFYIRTGKRLAKRITEIVVQFKQPPLKLFGETCDLLAPNLLVLSIQPEEKIIIRFGVKYPQSGNKIYPVNMLFGYQDTFKTEKHPPYERLLIDSMNGDPTLFVRQDGVEAMWAVVDPIISFWQDTPPMDFPNYPAGSWGPNEADQLMEKEGRRWISPLL